MVLCLAFERCVPPDRLLPPTRRLLEADLDLHRLDPPAPNGTLTIRDVTDPQTVEPRARDVWTAWDQHHPTVRAWLDAGLS